MTKMKIPTTNNNNGKRRMARQRKGVGMAFALYSRCEKLRRPQGVPHALWRYLAHYAFTLVPLLYPILIGYFRNRPTSTRRKSVGVEPGQSLWRSVVPATYCERRNAHAKIIFFEKKKPEQVWYQVQQHEKNIIVLI